MRQLVATLALGGAPLGATGLSLNHPEGTVRTPVRVFTASPMGMPVPEGSAVPVRTGAPVDMAAMLRTALPPPRVTATLQLQVAMAAPSQAHMAAPSQAGTVAPSQAGTVASSQAGMVAKCLPRFTGPRLRTATSPTRLGTAAIPRVGTVAQPQEGTGPRLMVDMVVHRQTDTAGPRRAGMGGRKMLAATMAAVRMGTALQHRPAGTVVGIVPQGQAMPGLLLMALGKLPVLPAHTACLRAPRGGIRRTNRC